MDLYRPIEKHRNDHHHLFLANCYLVHQIYKKLKFKDGTEHILVMQLSYITERLSFADLVSSDSASALFFFFQPKLI